MNKGYVYFGLLGSDFNPDIATERLGIQPTSVTYKGGPNEPPTTRYSFWRYASEEVVAHFVDADALIEQVVSDLKDKAEDIKQLVEELNIEAYLAVVLFISEKEGDSMPEFGFKPPTLDFLVRAGASIEVDTYRSYVDE